MRQILIILMLLTAAMGTLQAQRISYIETTSAWYHVYDQGGKKIHTFSTSQGQVVAYSESFYILKHGSWYHTCDSKGKKLHTLAESSVGQVLTATGDTFTSRKGNWIYTWDKNGRKLSTRYAK